MMQTFTLQSVKPECVCIAAVIPSTKGFLESIHLSPASLLASCTCMWRRQVGTCLLESCQTQLAGCLTDINCVKNLVCLNKCNGRPDESECQVTTGSGGSTRSAAAHGMPTSAVV